MVPYGCVTSRNLLLPFSLGLLYSFSLVNQFTTFPDFDHLIKPIDFVKEQLELMHLFHYYFNYLISQKGHLEVDHFHNSVINSNHLSLYLIHLILLAYHLIEIVHCQIVIVLSYQSIIDLILPLFSMQNSILCLVIGLQLAIYSSLPDLYYDVNLSLNHSLQQHQVLIDLVIAPYYKNI